MVLLESEMVELGAKAHPFELLGIDNKMHDLKSFEDAKILVVIFMCNHCPYVKAVIQRFIDIQHDYEKKSIQLVGINSNDDKNYPEDSFENMKVFAKEQGINFPYLCDESQKIAKTYHAVCTPDIFVYDKDRKLAYRGRLDDNWKEPEAVTSRDLRNALDEILTGKMPSRNQQPSIGCSIKWKSTI